MVEAAEAAPPPLGELADPGTLIFENDQVRVWELVMRPREWCCWHVHDYDHLLMVLEGTLIHAYRDTIEPSIREIPDGTTLVIPKTMEPEIAFNASYDRTLREIIIDLKDGTRPDASFASFTFLHGRSQADEKTGRTAA